MQTEDLDLSEYRIPDTDYTELAPITEVGLLTPQLIDLYVARKARPKQLNLTCGRSECDAELHTFRPPGIDVTATGAVPCTACGTELVGCEPDELREMSAIELFPILQREWIRHFFFHLPLTERVRRFAYRHGRDGLAQIARQQLRSGRMIGYSPRWDSQQTAMLRGTIVHWARHATATCCRRCIAYWHSIPMAATLNESDITYFQDLILQYIDLRLPELSTQPLKRVAKAIRPTFVRKVS